MSDAGDPRPPRVLRALLARVLPPGPVRDGLAGDLDELFAGRVRQRGRARADAWYARQLLSAAFHYRLKRPRSRPTPEKRPTTMLDSLSRDLAYALRTLRRRPGFAAVIVLTLALGIGANTAIYTLLDAVVLRPLPVPHPEQLVQVTYTDESRNGAYFTNPLWEQVRDRATGFTALAAFAETEFNTADGGLARLVRGQYVSGDYFTLFEARPALGRLLGRADDFRGCPPVAVLGHGFWRSEYGGRRDVIGTTISLDGEPFEIVGVAAPGFRGPEVGWDAQVYAPLCSQAVISGSQAALDARSRWWIRIMGRRDPSLTIEQLRARIKAIAPAVYAATVPPNWAAEDRAEYRGRTLNVFPAERGLSGLRIRYASALGVLMGAVALLLLIACANVANLLLARAASRRHDVAIRLAIGAGRRRLMHQLLTESALLAALGAVAGLFLAHWGTRGLVALIAAHRSAVSLDLSLDARVLGFTALITVVTTMIFGLAPALSGTRVSPRAALNAGGRGVAEGHGRFTLGKALVAAQVALSLPLLVGAGLLAGSLRNLSGMDPGFRADGVLVVNVDLRRADLEPEARDAVWRQALERIRALPGVLSAATAFRAPIASNSWNEALYVDGFTPETPMDALVWFNTIGDDYFETMGTRLIAGRDFDATDVAGAPPVAIVSRSMAAKFFGGKSPLGRQFRTKAGDAFKEPVTIVGLVEDAKYSSLREENSATVYRPMAQSAPGSAFSTVVLRAAGDPLSLVPAVRQVFAEVQPAASLEVTTLEAQVADSLQRERVLAVLSTLFGGVALALSMLGLYGVMAHTVTRRRNEIGVRIALGADRARVLRMVLRDIVVVVAAGAALGTAGALAAGTLVRSFLFGLEPTEPAIVIGAVLLLLAAALGAGLRPALRAAGADPVEALREE
ncbi:MAG TPA: ADOP family duplicated permease [Longimicrobiales bacterium]